MTSSMLNLFQPAETLDRVYSSGYYGYLACPAFQEAFLKPLGEVINSLLGEGRCLDVACGEGQLAAFVEGSYLGFDACPLAVAKAQQTYPTKAFEVGRIETWRPSEVFKVVVIGSLLSVTIREDSRLSLLCHYLSMTAAEYIIVYDLETLDTSEIDRHFGVYLEHHARAEVPGLEEVKKARQFKVYQA